MESTIISYGGDQYLVIDLEPFFQKEEAIYLARIKAEHFVKVYTVRPAEYDLEKHASLAQTFPEESDYYQHLITEDKKTIDTKDFQREPEGSRISSIVKYLTQEEYCFFPNTIIANCELINDWEQFEITEEDTDTTFFNKTDRPKYLSFLRKNNGKYSLIVPFLEKSILVIDGQHRLEGLRRSPASLLENYDLIVAFIIGYDRSVVANQFRTINYEQKPVNKSLLYQLTGEFSRQLDEVTFLHNVVKLLNELKESPFYSRVKMLGKTPRNLTQEAKKKLSISQAFLIDAMIRFVSPKAQGTTYPPIFLKYYQRTDEHIFIIRTIARFFNAVRIIKPEWENPEESLVSKGMGVAALLKVLSFIFQKIFIEELHYDWDKIDAISISDYSRFLKGLEKVDLSSNGPYGKTGSQGSITKIKNDIISNLDYFGNPADPKAFESDFKKSYQIEFNTALKGIKLSNKD